jgi:hypothetical protein
VPISTVEPFGARFAPAPVGAPPPLPPVSAPPPIAPPPIAAAPAVPAAPAAPLAPDPARAARKKALDDELLRANNAIAKADYDSSNNSLTWGTATGCLASCSVVSFAFAGLSGSSSSYASGWAAAGCCTFIAGLITGGIWGGRYLMIHGEHDDAVDDADDARRELNAMKY